MLLCITRVINNMHFAQKGGGAHTGENKANLHASAPLFTFVASKRRRTTDRFFC